MQNPVECAKHIIEKISDTEHENVSIGDLLMARQLQQTLGTNRLADLARDDLVEAIALGGPLGKWLCEKSPSMIASAITSTFAEKQPQEIFS